MHKRLGPVGAAAVAALAGVFLLPGGVLAGHDIPAQAKSIQSTLVRAFEPCLAPNTADPFTGIPACNPVVESDPGPCEFGAKGSGKIKAQVVPGDVKFQWSIQGLDPAVCDGLTLCPVGSVRTTDDACPATPCTFVDTPNFPLATSLATGCGVVAGGKAKGKGTFNTTYPGLISVGTGISMETLGCGLTNGLGGPRLVSCGILAP